MNRSFLIVPLCTFVCTVQAQPNLTLGSQLPVVGQAFAELSSSALPPGNSGPNQTYNFSSAGADPGPGFTYVMPNTAPGASYFPAATACSQSTLPNYTFMQYTGQGAFELGSEFPGSGRIIYTDPMQFLKFPLAFNTSWTDTYQGTRDMMGIVSTITGTLTAIADGYGTLQLPWGVVTDVLRVRLERDETMEVLGNVTEFEMVFHLYLRSGIAMPVAQRLTNTTTGPGGVVVTESLYYLTEASMAVGLEEVEVTPAIRLFPVPAHDRLLLSIADGTIAGVEVNEATGRAVRVPPVPSAAREVVLDVTGWARGPYVLRVRTTAGRTVVRTVAVQ